MAAKSAISELNKAYRPTHSVFVSANAGAGKTSLLTNRVLSLLLHGIAPERILCLTFTKAAATEMTSRIHATLGEWAMAEHQTLKNTLEEVYGIAANKTTLARARGLFTCILEMPEGLHIQTIHAFCQSLLKRFPLEARVSPHFCVMDARSEQEMLKEARLRLFTSARDSNPELQDAIAWLTCNTSEYSFHSLLTDIIQHKRKFITALAMPGGIEDCVAHVWSALKLCQDASITDIMAQHFCYDAATHARLMQAAHLLAAGSETEQALAAALIQWLPAADSDRQNKLENYTSYFLTADGKPRKRFFSAATITDNVLADALKVEQTRIHGFNQARLALATAHYTTRLLHIAAAFLALYDALKRARAVMDYDDLILAARRLLTQPGIAPWILFKLDGGIDHVLVDEAQDTSPEQWQIIDALTHEFFVGHGQATLDRSLFIVGDEKQSIFSFQGADVEALGAMQRYFAERIQAAAMPLQHLALTHSFRSTREVLAAVDAIFASDGARAGLMFEDKMLTHVPTRLEHPGLVEVAPLLVPADEETLSSSSLLARQVAACIHTWIADGVWLESKGRAVEPGDIMILVRQRTAFVDSLVRALKRKNIPVGGIDRMTLGDNLAIRDLVALGQVVLLPEDDLTLAALLKSPLFNLSEEQLFTLAWDRKRASLWERLRVLAGQDETYADSFNILSELRSRVDYLSPFALYSHALETLDGRRRILGRMGVEYADPIDEFLAQILLYERGHAATMQGFLHWFANSESEIKRDMDQAKHVIRIMTVHAAKGLQAPIVILPDTVEPPRFRERLLWQTTPYGALPLLVRSSMADDALSAALRERQKSLMLDEYRRLLYVALTRAEDRLYIFGASNKEAPNEQSWYALIRRGLSGIATEFTSADGTGLRLGSLPKTRGKAAVLPSTIALPPHHFADCLRPPPAEPMPPRPLMPSRLQDNVPANASPLKDMDVYQQGELTHRLLQYLPQTEPSKRSTLAKKIATGYRSLSEDAKNRCMQATLRIIEQPDYAFLFGPGSFAEAPVAGNIELGGNIISISGQIDRLFISETEVWIVDYKSNVKPLPAVTEVPRAYLRQLFLYQRLLAYIYPQKTIRTALLWTSTGELMPIAQPLLDETLLSSYI